LNFQWVFISSIHISKSKAVSIATGYRLDDRGVGVQVLVGRRIFSSPYHPDQLWGPAQLSSQWVPGIFPGGKVAGP
jgi:hypothetical protein